MSGCGLCCAIRDRPAGKKRASRLLGVRIHQGAIFGGRACSALSGDHLMHDRRIEKRSRLGLCVIARIAGESAVSLQQQARGKDEQLTTNGVIAIECGHDNSPLLSRGKVDGLSAEASVTWDLVPC